MVKLNDATLAKTYHISETDRYWLKATTISGAMIESDPNEYVSGTQNQKIEAALNNARCARTLRTEAGSLAAFFWHWRMHESLLL